MYLTFVFTLPGIQLHCVQNNEVKSVFLPVGDSSSNDKLIIRATATSDSFDASGTIIATVCQIYDFFSKVGY